MHPGPALALILTLAVGPSLAAAEDYYSADPLLCDGGALTSDDPAGLGVGNGSLLIFGSDCERVSPKVPLRDGWFTAEWSCQVEGEPTELPPFALRLSTRTAEVLAAGKVVRYERCG